MGDSRQNTIDVEVEMSDGSCINLAIEIKLFAYQEESVSIVRLNVLDTLELMRQVQAVITMFITESKPLSNRAEEQDGE